MHERTLLAIRSLRPLILARWKAQLQATPIRSPLAVPETLVYLMDWTLEEVFKMLIVATVGQRERSSETPATLCPCDANPLIDYFACLKSTFDYIINDAGSFLSKLSAEEQVYSALELNASIDAVARREIQTFCAVCQRNNRNPILRNAE